MKTNKDQNRMGKRLYISVLISSVLLGGCVNLNDKDLNADLSSLENLSYKQSLQEIAAIDWPSDRWWERYGDPQLNALIEKALNVSPSIKIAKARLAQAQGIAQQAGAVDDFQVGAGASAEMGKVSKLYKAYMPPSGWNDYGSITMDFSYDFDFWGKNHNLVAAATSDLAAAETESSAARLMLATSIANAYAELARLCDNRKTVESALAVRQKTVELLQKRYDNGLETLGSVNHAIAIRASIESELLGIKEKVALQKNAIAALTGAGPDKALMIQTPHIRLTKRFGLPSDLGIGFIGHRPDVTAARWRAAAAADRVGVAKAQFYPDVSISGFLGTQAFGLDNLFDHGNSAGSVQPAIYLPIFTGGRLDGQLNAAQASYQLAVSNYDNTLTQALHQVADVVTSSRSIDAQIDKMQEAVNAANHALQIASNRYKGGLATYLEVLVAEESVLNNERALVNLQSRVFGLDIALVHALGGGFHTSTPSAQHASSQSSQSL